MTPSPILKVLSTIRQNGVRSLLMGGQACVLYGAAEFSRDTDILQHAATGSEQRLSDALRAEEDAERQADRLYWAPLKRELEQLRHAR